MRPAEAWEQQLERGGQGGLRSCLDLPNGMDLWAGTERAGGEGAELRPMLGLGMGRQGAEKIRRDFLEGWNGLDVRLQEHLREGGRELSIVLRPTSGSETLFTYLAEEVYAGLIEGEPDADPQPQVLATLRTWSRYLRPQGGAIGEQEARGLHAELRFLLDLAVPACGWKAATEGWHGPERAQHDFDLPGALAEVKATTARERTIHVRSVEQLSPASGRPVLLAEAEIAAGEGETLAEVRDEVLTACPPEHLGKLRLRLAQAGLADLKDFTGGRRVTAWRFQLAGHPGFPAIRRGTLPPGIADCSYRADLAASTAPQLERDEAAMLIGKEARQEGTEDGAA